MLSYAAPVSNNEQDISNSNKDILLDEIGKYIDTNNHLIQTVEATKKPWEGPAVNMVHEYCRNRAEPQQQKNTIVFYFHNKGASKPFSSHTLYWRKYLEYFLLERPQLCLGQLLYHNASTCGANWHPKLKNHYSGNFWSATCKHIVQLDPIPMNETQYVAAEMWLGKIKRGTRISSYYSATKDLYKEIILPEEYVHDRSVWYDGY